MVKAAVEMRPNQRRLGDRSDSFGVQVVSPPSLLFPLVYLWNQKSGRQPTATFSAWSQLLACLALGGYETAPPAAPAPAPAAGLKAIIPPASEESASAQRASAETLPTVGLTLQLTVSGQRRVTQLVGRFSSAELCSAERGASLLHSALIRLAGMQRAASNQRSKQINTLELSRARLAGQPSFATHCNQFYFILVSSAICYVAKC